MTEPVSIDLKDGKRHALKFTARGLRAMSMVHGYRTLREMAEVLAEDVGLAAFLYAGLLWESPTMTIEDACDMIDHYRDEGGDFGVLAKAIGEGLVRSGHIAPLRPNGVDPKPPAGTERSTVPAVEAPPRLTS